MNFFALAKRITEFERPTRDTPSEGSQPRNQRAELRRASREESKCIWIDNEGRHQSQPIEILDRSDGGLGFRVSQPLVPGHTIWVETGGGLKGVVRSCDPDGEGYRAGLIRVRRERRRVDREPIGGDLTLFWSKHPGCAIASPCLIRDLTADGMQLEVPMEVPVSTVVRLEGRQIECEGIIRYCQPTDGLYLIGIELMGRHHEKNTAPETGNWR